MVKCAHKVNYFYLKFLKIYKEVKPLGKVIMVKDEIFRDEYPELSDAEFELLEERENKENRDYKAAPAASSSPADPDSDSKVGKTQKRFAVMQYMSYMNCSYADIVNKLQSGTLAHLKSWCICLHDKDVREDGTPKPPHFHAVLTFTQAKTYKTVADFFGIEPQFVEKIKHGTKAAQLYLVHHNDKAKYQYPVSEVTASFDYADLVDDTPSLENVSDVLHNIESGLIRPYDIMNKVSIEFYTKYKRRINDAFEYVIKKKGGLDRDMKCYYFYGASGSGKTTFAKDYAAAEGWSTFVSSGGKNPLDDYAGQDCIILDDIRGNVFSLADFLKLTDNNTDSMVGCRYYNKSLAYCKAIICTSVLSLDDLYSGVTDEHKEPLKQLIRRFTNVIEFTPENMIILEAVDDFSRLEPRLKCENPVAALFDREVAKRKAEEFAKAFGLKYEVIPPESVPNNPFAGPSTNTGK